MVQSAALSNGLARWDNGLRSGNAALAPPSTSGDSQLTCISAPHLHLEVRDASWYAPEVYELLHTANVPLVHAEGEKAPSPVETLDQTADFVYARLRKMAYTEAETDAWAERLRAVMAGGKDVYAYFRHDEDGSNGLSAIRLRAALS